MKAVKTISGGGASGSPVTAEIDPAELVSSHIRLFSSSFPLSFFSLNFGLLLET